MSQYPRDEFDKVPESSVRQGVHRERLIPSRSTGLGLLITVGVLALLIGLAAYFVLPRLGIGAGSGDQSPAAGAPASASASATATAAASATATPTSNTDEDEAEASPSPTAASAPTQTPSPTPTPTVPAIDPTQPVAVFNASGVTGLGAGVSGRMSAAGWSVGAVANWTGAPQQGSGVYYSAPELAANAQAVGAQLGIPVLETPGFTSVTVVLGPGYQ
ncbi:LytR C-terminal domain-containing protein [Arthrobacter zhaoxinii]|uniref:LytR C-terminal domain-containing protein n=1 Tax=Arthrobacter zhaoxinii TaxID=2964616 RepID=A0ABY5YR93_9MICC|nr:LytR C-terminal domain-containing protein [Arthrobacter zhaoxinii]UWX97631.1 LytR C-terminal domain-containing protein [Arthrobacter zhaoxinii]